MFLFKTPNKQFQLFHLFILVFVNFLCFTCFSTSAFAAPTFDRGSAPPNDQTVTPLTWQHTTGNFPNRILIVSTWTGFLAPPQPVTYNDVQLTKYKEIVHPQGTFTIWYLKDPPVGTYPITVISPYGDSYAAAAAGASTFYNVDLTNPFGPTSLTSGKLDQGQNIVISDTLNNTNSTQLIVDSMGIIHYQPAADPSAVGTGQTRHWFHLVTSLSSISHLINGGSSKPATNGNTTMMWTTTSPSPAYTSYWHHIVFALNGVDVSTPTTPTQPTLPTTGNIINLNFGITNLYPWVQTVCGDFRMDDGVTNRVPTGQYAIITKASCTIPGIAFTGDESATFGKGQASSTNQIVGGTIYPEVYAPPNTGGIFTSYAYLNQKAQSLGEKIIDLETVCPNLSNCTLPINLQDGIYKASTDVTLNSFSSGNNHNYVFIIDGNLTINGNILIPQSSTALFSTSGNIIIPASLGNSLGDNTANLSGIFSAGRSFIMQSNGTCNDRKLNIEGTLIVNAAQSGGRLQNERDLCGGNATTPILQLTQRLDFVLNMPEFLKIQTVTTEEVAP